MVELNVVDDGGVGLEDAGGLEVLVRSGEVFYVPGSLRRVLHVSSSGLTRTLSGLQGKGLWCGWQTHHILTVLSLLPVAICPSTSGFQFSPNPSPPCPTNSTCAFTVPLGVELCFVRSNTNVRPSGAIVAIKSGFCGIYRALFTSPG